MLAATTEPPPPPTDRPAARLTVLMAQSPTVTAEDFSFAVVLQTITVSNQQELLQWETHDGVQSIGQLDGTGNVIPGTESMVTVRDAGVLFEFPVPTASDFDDATGFESGDIDAWARVVNGCSLSNTLWVFAAATTDVEYTMTVTDTASDTTKVYENPFGASSAAITDTSAFATCP